MSSERNAAFYAVRTGIVLLSSVVLISFLAVRWQHETHDNVVTVYAFSDMLSSDVFNDFEKQTGITVNVKHFEAIEEIMTKLVFTSKNEIDLIAPSDSMVEIFTKEGLLQPLDRTKIEHFNELDLRLLGRFYDPENKYSVPFSWSAVGIGYDTRVVTTVREQIEWDLIFGTIRHDGLHPPSEKYGKGVDLVCLGEDQWETLFLGALHLFDSFENISSDKQAAVAGLLKKQKRWLECYTNNLQYFLISGVTPAVVIPAAYMAKICREHLWADFTIPKKGSLLFIGNMAIPKKSNRPDLAHKVINYLLSVQGGLACFEEHAYNPSNRHAYQSLPASVRNHPYLFPNDAVFATLNTFHNKLPLKRVEHLWQSIKL